MFMNESRSSLSREKPDTSAQIMKQSKHNRFNSIDRSIHIKHGVLKGNANSVVCPAIDDEATTNTLKVTLTKKKKKTKLNSQINSFILCEENQLQEEASIVHKQIPSSFKTIQAANTSNTKLTADQLKSPEATTLLPTPYSSI